MACGCGSRALREEVGNSLVKSGYMPSAGPNGVYELYSHPGCFSAYNGDFRRDSLYVVGLGTERERLFVRKDSKEAIRYAKSEDLILHHLLANTFCAEAMVEFFGS